MADYRLTCYDCGRSYALETRNRCSCGEPLWFPVVAADFDDSNYDRFAGMWRYKSSLPVDTVIGVGAAAGGTPLVRATALDDYAGCTVHVKDEGENPSGSFKDRGSAVGVSYAVEEGVNVVGTLSYGNMAMSVAAAAASADLPCIVIVPTEIPPVRFQAIGQYDPTLVEVDDFSAVNHKLTEIEEDLDIEFLNADVPLRTEGQKTIAYEVCDQFYKDVPDAIVLPVASGGHASAVWKGLIELEKAGRIAEIPRLYLTQAEASDPIARAYRDGADSVSEAELTETIAVSIVNKSPLSGNRALKAARTTGGGVLSVSEAEIREATGRMASEDGLCVEPASATTLAGARKLSQSGEIAPDEDVVLVATGTGFKELAGVEPDVETSTITAANAEERLTEIAREYRS